MPLVYRYPILTAAAEPKKPGLFSSQAEDKQYEKELEEYRSANIRHQAERKEYEAKIAPHQKAFLDTITNKVLDEKKSQLSLDEFLQKEAKELEAFRAQVVHENKAVMEENKAKLSAYLDAQKEYVREKVIAYNQMEQSVEFRKDSQKEFVKASNKYQRDKTKESEKKLAAADTHYTFAVDLEKNQYDNLEQIEGKEARELPLKKKAIDPRALDVYFLDHFVTLLNMTLATTEGIRKKLLEGANYGPTNVSKLKQIGKNLLEAKSGQYSLRDLVGFEVEGEKTAAIAKKLIEIISIFLLKDKGKYLQQKIKKGDHVGKDLLSMKLEDSGIFSFAGMAILSKAAISKDIFDIGKSLFENLRPTLIDSIQRLCNKLDKYDAQCFSNIQELIGVILKQEKEMKAEERQKYLTQIKENWEAIENNAFMTALGPYKGNKKIFLGKLKNLYSGLHAELEDLDSALLLANEDLTRIAKQDKSLDAKLIEKLNLVAEPLKTLKLEEPFLTFFDNYVKEKLAELNSKITECEQLAASKQKAESKSSYSSIVAVGLGAEVLQRREEVAEPSPVASRPAVVIAERASPSPQKTESKPTVAPIRRLNSP